MNDTLGEVAKSLDALQMSQVESFLRSHLAGVQSRAVYFDPRSKSIICGFKISDVSGQKAWAIDSDDLENLNNSIMQAFPFVESVEITISGNSVKCVCKVKGWGVETVGGIDRVRVEVGVEALEIVEVA